jgi:hypothetical protein
MTKGIAMLCAALVLGCGSVSEQPDAGGGDDQPDASGDAPPAAAVPVAPVAPAVGNAMYQGTQRQFHTDTGATCTGRVAASMGQRGFCYLAADDTVQCAGSIAGTSYGMSFSSTGQTGVEQIMVMFLDNGMCVTRTDHTVWCMGTNTNAFGTSWPTFTRWTARDDLAAIATGTWDQICGITLTGQVYCGGLGPSPGYGNPPIAVGAPGQSSLWVNTSGAAQLSDTAVLRPGESRTECQVRANGLTCVGGGMFGPTDGTVVAGTPVQGSDPFNPTTCWLVDSGTVSCTNGPRFASGQVLLLAANYYSDSLCAIYRDGSVWCIGSNEDGKLGTGNTASLAVETQVAPPGSARVRCDP